MSSPDASRATTPSSTAFTTTLSNEILGVVSMLSLSGPERTFRESLIARTKSLVQQSFPGSRVEVYGSWATNLALPSSDIDFVVINPQKNRDMLSGVADALEHNSLKCTAVLPTARVPVVKFECPSSGLRGDITFGVSTWESSVKLVKQLLDEYSSYHAKEIIMLLKLVLVLTSNNEVCKGGLSSYGLCLMVFAFLKSVKEKGQTLDVGATLIGFLNHYKTGGVFDPLNSTVDISSPQGFRKGKITPTSAKSKSSWSVQDPLTQTNNVTEQCFCIHQIADHFATMSQKLEVATPTPGEEAFCPILRSAIVDLHHFQHKRAQLLHQWEAQDFQSTQQQQAGIPPAQIHNNLYSMNVQSLLSVHGFAFNFNYFPPAMMGSDGHYQMYPPPPAHPTPTQTTVNQSRFPQRGQRNRNHLAKSGQPPASVQTPSYHHHHHHQHQHQHHHHHHPNGSATGHQPNGHSFNSPATLPRSGRVASFPEGDSLFSRIRGALPHHKKTTRVKSTRDAGSDRGSDSTDSLGPVDSTSTDEGTVKGSEDCSSPLCTDPVLKRAPVRVRT